MIQNERIKAGVGALGRLLREKGQVGFKDLQVYFTDKGDLQIEFRIQSYVEEMQKGKMGVKIEKSAIPEIKESDLAELRIDIMTELTRAVKYV